MNYPSGMGILPGNSALDAEYERWYDENEETLLLEFLDKQTQKDPDFPAVKDWTRIQMWAFEDFANNRFEEIQ